MSPRAQRLAQCESAAEAMRGPWRNLRPHIAAEVADRLEAGGLEALTDAELAELEAIVAAHAAKVAGAS